VINTTNIQPVNCIKTLSIAEPENVLFDGDERLSAFQRANIVTSDGKSKRKRRNVPIDIVRRWDSNIIPYEIASKFSK